ncbi:MAG: T9SS type A sorting domain-containing protein [Bacteroidales bacterium]|nr:T9SS type A sorting domain-containing protein [Bacteroidales bacterium]
MKKFTLITKILLVFFLTSSVAFAQLNTKSFLTKAENNSSSMILKDFNASGNAPKTLFGDKGAKGWALQFAYPVNVGTGVHTDGDYFYVTMWNNDTIFRYDMAGNYVDGFVIPGITGGKLDLAYDGNHFYAGVIDATGTLGTAIYEMDFVNHTLIGTINTTALVSEIAYDPHNDAFWVGDWNSDLVLASRTGTTLSTIPHGSINLAQMIGAAYDTVSQGGPFLWIHDIGAGSDQARIYQIDVTAAQLTGYMFDVQADLGVSSTAGGLFIADSIVPGEFTLGGMVQNNAFFGYNLAACVPDTNDVGVVALLAPQTGSGLSSSEILEVEIKNFGTTAQTGFDVTYILNGGAPVTETVTATINAYNTYVYTFGTTCDLSALTTYNFTIYTSLTGDLDNSNDTIYETVAHIAPINLDAYCYANNGVTEGPSIFNMQFPSIITNIADHSSMDPVYSGTWGVGNKWFAIVSSTNQFITFDTITGARSIIGISNLVGGTNESWTGISYDYSTSTMYGMSYNGTASVLYTIDIWTAAATQVGNTSGLMINLACNLAGELYALDLSDDNLYSINKFTGAGTLVGATGFNSNYAQDMEFDRASNALFMAAYADPGGGQLRIVDVVTGMTTLIGAFENGAEITGLAIPYYAGVGIDEIVKDFSYNVYPNPASDQITVKCTHNISEYTIINYVGQVVLHNVVNSDNFNVNVSSLSTGMYFIQLDTENGVVTEKISVE